MYTRCPHCHTLYRIQPEQLEAAEGKARCCRCDRVFNALDNLQETLTSHTEKAPPAPTGPAGLEPATPTGKHSIYQGASPKTEETEQTVTGTDSRLTERDEDDDSFLLDAADEVTSEDLFLSSEPPEVISDNIQKKEPEAAPAFAEEEDIATEEEPSPAPTGIA
jgi:predicted Zn finger-like uncharacterized protein